MYLGSLELERSCFKRPCKTPTLFRTLLGVLKSTNWRLFFLYIAGFQERHSTRVGSTCVRKETEPPEGSQDPMVEGARSSAGMLLRIRCLHNTPSVTTNVTAVVLWWLVLHDAQMMTFWKIGPKTLEKRCSVCDFITINV